MGNKKEKNEAEQNIITALKEYRGGNVKLPNTITFSMSESANPSLIIKLQRRAVGLTEGKEKPFNMQEDGAAFEGWAVIIRALYKEETWKEQKEKYEFLAKWNGKIILDAENAEKPLPPYQVTEGHYGRFLYRAMRFQETYGKWFQLSKEVQKAADDFKKVLNESTFTNNLPKGKAQTNTSLENTVEAEFEKQEDLFQKIMKKKIPKISKGISRQLPCGLFQGEIKQANRIFTGGKSAIDFWNYTKIDGKNNMTIAELKAKSKMIGIITEIFFMRIIAGIYSGQNRTPHLKKILMKRNKQQEGIIFWQTIKWIKLTRLC